MRALLARVLNLSCPCERRKDFVKYNVCSEMYSLYSEMYSVCSEMYSLYSEMYSVYSEMYSLYSEMYSVCSEMYSLYSEIAQTRRTWVHMNIRNDMILVGYVLSRLLTVHLTN